MDVGAAFIAKAQAAEAAEPGKGALDHPAMPAQPLATLDAAAGDPRRDPALPTRGPTVRRIVPLVRVQLRGPLAGSPQRPLDRLDRVEQRRQGQAIGVVGRAQAGREREALAVDQQMLLRARLAAIGRVRPGNLAPLFAGTSRLSRHARDQSIASAIPSWSSSTRCRPSQMPAACQSRNRRQHVTPLPQPISRGSIRQGMPLCKTKSTPVRAARAGTGGRPPFGLGGSGGNSGSMKLHSSSLTIGLLMPGYASSLGPRF